MPLERRRLADFTKGWFVGDFQRTLAAGELRWPGELRQALQPTVAQIRRWL